VTMASNKDNAIADKLRNYGNTFFKQGRYFDALIKYNESLCRAETGSANIALAYANRSAVFMELKMYEKCLKNIQQAKDAGYPQGKIHNLNDRYERATTLMAESHPATTAAAQAENDPFQFYKLSYPAHPKNPDIVNCVKLAENAKYGRHIIASKDLGLETSSPSRSTLLKCFIKSRSTRLMITSSISIAHTVSTRTRST